MKLNAKVNSIHRHGHRWTVSEAGTDHEFDHLVLAVPARVMAGLLEDVASTAAVELAKIESASTAIVILGVSKDDIQRPVETFGFVVPLSEKRRILAGSFASHKFDGRSPENHVLIRVFIGGAMQADLLDGTDQELVQLAREELSDLIGLKGEPLVTRVVRWNEAMPQYHVGHGEVVRAIDEDISQIPNLSIASNALHGVGIAPVIKQSQKIALEITKSLKGSSDLANGESGTG